MCYVVVMAKPKLPKCPYRPFDLMEYDGRPVFNVPGDSWAVLSRGFAPTAKETRNQLVRTRERLQWPRPMLAAFMGVPRETIRMWENGGRKPSGAATRLIWLLDLLAEHPEKLKDGLDVIFWGRREEIEAFGKEFGIINPSPPPPVQPASVG